MQYFTIEKILYDRKSAPRARVPQGKPHRPFAAMFDIVLYQPEIPFNTGAIGRTCVALGVKLWLVRPLGFRLEDRRVRRAGLDYWELLEYEVVDDWQQLCQRLCGRRFWLLTKTATQPYTAVRFAAGDVLVFGSESRGLPASLLAANSNNCLRIPMRPEARSLNLAVAVGVVAFEVYRQLHAD